MQIKRNYQPDIVENPELRNPMGSEIDNSTPRDVPSEDDIGENLQGTAQYPLTAIIESEAVRKNGQESKRRLVTTGSTRVPYGTKPERLHQGSGTQKAFRILAVLFGVVIALCTCRDIFISNGPIIMADEMGYWGNAAVFAGKDWHDVMQTISFYAYGYSFLLVPLFWLNLPMYIMYKVAIVMNLVMLLLAFALAYQCLRRLFTALQPLPALLIAGVTTLYTNTVVQAGIAWDETLLYLLYWTMFWLILRLLEKPSYKYVLLLAVCGGYMYMVHMRTMGIMIALAITMLLFWAAKRINGKQLLAFFAFFALVLLLQNGIKIWTNQTIYTGETTAGANDYGGQMEKLLLLVTTADGWASLLRSICGKFFYTGAATLLLGIASLRLLFTDFFGALWQWVCDGFKKFSARKLPSVFLMLSFGGLFMIDAITMAGEGRLDLPIYGRYMEIAFGPLIAIGLALLVLGRVGIGEALGSCGVLLLCAFVPNGMINGMLSTPGVTLVTINVTALTWMIEWLTMAHNALLIVALLSIAMFLLMWGGQYAFGRYLEVGYGSTKRIRMYRVMRPIMRALFPVLIAGFAWIWCTCGFESTARTDTVNNLRMTQIEKMIETRGENPSRLYWVCDSGEERDPWVAMLQMRLGVVMTNVDAAEFRQMELDPDGIYIGGTDTPSNIELAERCRRVIANDLFNIYVVSGSKWDSAAVNMPLNLNSDDTLHINCGSSANTENLDTDADDVLKGKIRFIQGEDGNYTTAVSIGVESNGQEGTVLQSNGVNLPAGQYKIDFILTLNSSKGEALGKIIMCEANGTAMHKTELNSSDFKPGVSTMISMSVGTMLDQEIDGATFRFEAEEGVEMTLKEVRFTRVGEATAVISADNNEMDTLTRLLELDYEKHPLYVLPHESQLGRASVDDIQATFPDRTVAIADLSVLRDQPGILLIPTNRSKQIYTLLGEYTIAEKIGNYTVLLPSDSTAYSEFVGHGGIPMSDGYNVQLRYYAGQNTRAAGAIDAIPPAGTYQLLMRPAFSNLLTGHYGHLELRIDGKLCVSVELEKGTDRDSSFYMPVTITVDGTEEIAVEINTDANLMLSDMNISLRELGDMPFTYGDRIA